MSAPRLQFPNSLLGPVAVSSGAVLLVPGIDRWALVVLAMGFVVRLARLWLRREPSPSRVWLALFVSVPTAATAWIAIQAKADNAAGPALVSVACALLGLALASPPTSAALSILVGLSLAQIAGAAVLVMTREMSVICVVYVAVLVPVMARLATVLAAPRRSDSAKVIRHVCATGTRRRSGVVGALRFLVAALPLGLWFFLALPDRSAGGPSDSGPGARSEVAASDAERGNNARNAATGPSALDSFVSGGKTSMRLTFVSKVKQNQKPVLLVTVDGGVQGPEPLTLRGMAYDVYTGSEWVRSTPRNKLSSAAPDDDGWVAIAPSTRPTRRHLFEIEDIAGDPNAHLFLVPDAIRVQLDARVADRRVGTAPDGVVFAYGALPPGGRYREEAELSPDRSAARGRRSDASVAPDPHVVESPPDAARFLEIARRVVAERTDAAARAERIESWLRREFAYTTDMPAVRRDRPVLDFLERIRRGHCEYFASSMALLLRSLGHATRLAVGFRGGDWLKTQGRWSFRGNHAHAWCEVFYEGLGWIAYDPTPPQDTSGEKTSAAGGDDADGQSLWDRVIRFSVADRRRIGEEAVRLGRAVVGAITGETPFGIWPTLAVVLLAIVWFLRSRHARSAALGAVDRAGDPLGPYGLALTALRKAGIPLKAGETGGELARRFARLRPDGASCFARLTSLHESARFGNRPPTAADREEAELALGTVRRLFESPGAVRPGPLTN